jgi:uncharacterized phage-associated protein
MQLIKLVYIAHGWNLALRGEPLISDEIQAWKYGPVMPALYGLFKDQLGKRKCAVECINDEAVYLSDLDMVISDCDISPFAQILLNKVYVRFKDMSGKELSDMTHKSDTPWCRVWDDGSGRDRKIEDKETKAYYEKHINKEHFDSLSQFAPITSYGEANDLLKAAGILDKRGLLVSFYKNEE